jgi:hypothetical protein
MPVFDTVWAMPQPDSGTAVDAVAKTSRRSWVDLLIAAIERLPGPAWVFYLGVSIAFAVASVGLRWLDGTEKPGVLHPDTIVWALLTIYGLAFVHLLQGTARRALAAFRPALGALDSQYTELERRLTTMSPVVAAVVVFAGIAIQIVGSSTSPSGWGITAHSSLLTNVFTYVQEGLLGIFLVVFLIRAVGQFRLIARIHRDATNINLYESEPHNAFSRLTFATSVSITVPYAIADIITASSSPYGVSPFELLLLLSAIFISVAIFILPLNGMHRHLVRLKNRAIVDSDLRFESAASALHSSVDAGRYDQIDSINKALLSLVIENDKLKKVSTWPWRAETLRGFLSSIALPIVLWLITTLLGRFV